MKKVLLLSVCLIVSVLLGGGKSWASVTFSESDGTLTITLSGTASDDDVTAVKNKMNNSSYTKVVVDGGTITDKFVQGIVYPNGSANTTLTTLDLSKTSYTNATFAKTAFYEGNENSWKVGQLTIATLSLPGNVTTIGKEALTNMLKLEEFVFPDKLDKIEDGAFFNCKALKNLKFNSNLRYIGNSAFASDAQIIETSIIIPSSVKYIGPAAFFGRRYQDVYFTSDRAPVMPNGKPVENISAGDKECTAFDGICLMLNNGFVSTPSGSTIADNTSTGYANRENYINGGAYMTILHYPNDITRTDDLKTYYDTTRKYETKLNDDGTFSTTTMLTVGSETTTLKGFNTETSTQVTVGYKDTYAGDSYIWPSQSQWMRSYITAVNGVEWDGVTKYRTTLEQWEKDVLAEAGYTSDAGYSEDDLSYIAHLGTRMFVLANNDSRKDGDYVINMKGGKWWTLCVPFNMTKAQVSEVFGEKTNVCLFNKVERTISQSNPNNNKIHLYFTVDVFKHKCEPKDAQTGRWEYSKINENNEPADNDIVIYAHESYMIHPSKTDEDAKFVVKAGDYDVVTGNPEPTIITSEVLTYVQDADAENTPDYRFIGNYIGSDDATATDVQTVTVPAYSYAYAKRKTETDYKFWFLTDSKAVWRANKCVVQTTNRDLGKEDETNFFGGNVTSAKQASYFGSADGGNGDTTSIDEEYVIIAGEKADAPIYSVEGRMVSRNGDTTGLAKGVYIQNGNKFIVK